MTKQRDERTPADTKRVMDEMLRNMLASKPEPHVQPKPKRKAKKPRK